MAHSLDTKAGAGSAGRPTVLREALVLLAATPFLLFPDRLPLGTLLSLIALALVWTAPLLGHRLPMLATPLNGALLVFVSMVGVAILATADPAVSLDKATGLILGVSVWRVLVLAINSRREFSAAFVIFVVLSLALTVVGFLSIGLIAKVPAISDLLPQQDLIPASAGIDVHPNQLAGLICLYLPALLSVLLGRVGGGVAGRVLLAAAALPAVAVLLLTQSRGGWVGAAAGLLALVALWAGSLDPSPVRRLLRLLVVVALLVAAALVLLRGPASAVDLWLDPPAESIVGDLTTLNYRKELWPWALAAAGDFPLTGVGLGAFRVVGPRFYPLDITAGQDFGHAHNQLLQVVLDIGVPGLVAYVALLLLAAAAGWRARRDAFLRPYALGLLAGLVALHVYGLADALALGAKPGLVFWYTIGLLTVLTKRQFHEHATDH